MKMLARLSTAAAVVVVAYSSTDPSYDHQTATYTTQFAPVSQTTGSVNATLFFSPEHSTDTLVSLIQSVGPGGTIEIGTPGASSWGSGNCALLAPRWAAVSHDHSLLRFFASTAPPARFTQSAP